MTDELFGFKESTSSFIPSSKGRKGKSKWNKLFEKVHEGKTFYFDAESTQAAKRLYANIRTTLMRQNIKDIQISVRNTTVCIGLRKED